MNTKKMLLPPEQRMMLNNIIRTYVKKNILYRFGIFSCFLFFSFVFYLFCDCFFAVSSILCSLDKPSDMGSFETILYYFCLLILHIPLIILIILFCYNIFAAFYFKFKKNYSIKDFLEMKKSIESSLKDIITVTDDDIAVNNNCLLEKVQKLVLAKDEKVKIKLRLNKKDFLKDDEINLLKKNLKENETTCENLESEIFSIKIKKEIMQFDRNKKKQLEEKVKFLETLVENLRVEHL